MFQKGTARDPGEQKSPTGIQRQISEGGLGDFSPETETKM